jgi:cell division GTPase FtsZ
MREMAEEPNKNEKKAGDISINPVETDEAELIRIIQTSKTLPLGVEKPEGRYERTVCPPTQEFPGNTSDTFEISDSGLPALDLEQYDHKINEETGVKDESKGSIRYAWIGAGQCGGRLAKSFYDLGYKKVLAVNTNRRELDSLDIPRSQKFLLGMGQEGSGKDLERGAKAVQQHMQDILHLACQTFGTQVDHIMVCFGAGGSAGSGSVVELVDIAKRYARYIGLKNPGKSVGVVMTFPAAGKVGSPWVAENAYTVANKLSHMAKAGQISPLIIVDNDKISRIYPGLTARSLWLSINNTFAGLFDLFNKVSALGSRYTSFDRLDYLSIIESGGCLIMGRTKVDKLEGRFSISEAVKNNFEKTLFANGLDMSTVKECGCIVVGGKEIMAKVKGLQEKIDYAFYVLSEMTGKATIHRGIYEDNSDSLRVFTIIGGLDSPAGRLEELSTELYFRPEVFDNEGLLLWERKEDILSLAEYFLAKEANFYGREDKILSSDVKKVLLNYSWPGNIRELAKAMERAYELTIGRIIQLDSLPFKMIFSESENYPTYMLPILDNVKRRIITKAFELFQGRRPSVARILGIEPQLLERLIEELNFSAAKQR